MDLRDEILRLSEADFTHVREMIPAGVLDIYLLLPLDPVPTLTGNKDTFPSPEGIGVLDND